MRATAISVWDGDGSLYSLKSGTIVEGNDYVIVKVPVSRMKATGFADRLPIDHHPPYEWEIYVSTSSETGYYEGRVEDAKTTANTAGTKRWLIRCLPSTID